MMSKRKQEGGGVNSRVVNARLESDEVNTHQAINSEGDISENKDCPSCLNHFATAEAYNRHILIKKANKTAVLIERNKIRKYSHTILCPKLDCCFSTTKKEDIKVHLRMHNLKIPDKFLCLKIGEGEDDFITGHQCRICCKIFNNDSSLRSHQSKCSGKFLHACNYCTETFQERKDFIQHLTTEHPPETNFQVTGIFVGKSRKRDLGRGGLKSVSVERTIALLAPGIISVGDVFSEDVVRSLRLMLEWEIAAHARVNARISVNSLVSKDTAEEMIVKPMITSSSSQNLSRTNQITSFIERAMDHVSRSIASLHALPSGFRIHEINTLTLITCPLPDFRGGCGEALRMAHDLRERRGLKMIDEDVTSGEQGKKCLRDSILYGLYAREAFGKIRASEPCSMQHHSPECECYKAAYKKFREESSKSAFWDPFFERDDWSGVQLPGGIDDLEKFTKKNPEIRVTAFQLHNEKLVTVFRPGRTTVHKRFIYIVHSTFVNQRTQEIEAHWFPVENLSLLSQKISASSSRKRLELDTCHRCLARFSLARDCNKRGEDIKSFDGCESARDKKLGLIRYRDTYCDLKVPTNLRLTRKQREHEEACSKFQEGLNADLEGPTFITPPSGLYYQFSNFGRTVDQRYTAFFDTECFVTIVTQMCIACEMLTRAASSESRSEAIYNECQKSNHIKQKFSKCGICSSNFRRLLLDNTCSHEVEEKILGSCRECHELVERGMEICEHEKTTRVKRMKASGYALILYDNYFHKVVYENSYYQEKEEDIHPIHHFLNTLSGDVIPNIVEPGLLEYQPLKMTELQEREFMAATTCHACGIEFAELRKPEEDKLRDHCHITSEYRGAACRSCNRKLTVSRQISIMCHNLGGFDSHLLVKNLSGFDSYKIIPRTKEKFVAITMTKKEGGERFGPEGKDDEAEPELLEDEREDWAGGWGRDGEDERTDVTVAFKDTLSFLSGSLDRNTQLLKKSRHEFPYLKKSSLCKTDGRFDEEKFDLLLRKGVYPYELIQTHSDLARSSLPKKEEFHSSLGVGSDISEEDYNHAREVWDKFGCKTMLDYSHIYVRLDSYLLLESWRYTVCENTFQEFGLHPAHYYTLPSMAMDCCLYRMMKRNRTRRIELLRDEEMIRFATIAKRGGLTSTLGDRLAFSRHGAGVIKGELENMRTDENEDTIKQLQKAVDDTISEGLKPGEDFYILYLDANNLYGDTQTKQLPLCDFRWADDNELEILNSFFAARNEGSKISWNAVDENKTPIFDPDTGYFIQADLEVPEEMMNVLENFPPAPHRATAWDISQFTEMLLEEAGKEHKPTPKLCVTLERKEGYVTHHALLDLYSEIGIRVTNVKKALRFTQDTFLKDWVDVNTAGRKAAARMGNEVKKAYHKLQVNSVFGKFGENLITQSDLSAIFYEDEFTCELLSPLYKNHLIVSEDLCLIEKYKEKVELNRPVQISSAILELSKATMYKYFYRVLKPAFHSRISVLYTDTDSLVLKLKSSDIEGDFKKIEDTLDTSNFPDGHPLHHPERASELGFFKSEVGRNEISVFTAIRPKCYTMAVEAVGSDGKRVQKLDNKLKGVDRAVVKNMSLETYLRTILLNESQSAKSFKISSKSHSIFVEQIRKQALSNIDDKVKVLLCGVHTRKYGCKNYTDRCSCPFSRVCK